MDLGFFSVVPALVAIFVAVLTNRLALSFLVAIFLGGWGAAHADGLVWHQVSFWLRPVFYLFQAVVDPVNLVVLGFLVPIMLTVILLVRSGGFHGLAMWLSLGARSPRSARITTAFMGLVLFFDDYTNCLIVGSTMRPITDRYRISRAKLAFLIDAMSAPVTGLSIVSTWVSYEVGLFSQVGEQLGLAQDGYSMLLDALPYRFYCLMMLGFVFIAVILDRDYGPMAKAERRAHDDNQLLPPKAMLLQHKGVYDTKLDGGIVVTPWTAVIPLALLFTMIFVGVYIDGRGWTVEEYSPVNPLFWRQVLTQSEYAIVALAIAACGGVVSASAASLALAKMPVRVLGHTLFMGLRSCALPATVLLLAWTLKSACDDLGTGAYLARVALEQVRPFAFPAIVFAIAGVVAFSTGSSWGTMAILLPTAIPAAFQLDGQAYGLVTVMSLAAVLDGSIFGDHCSPISDTTIMASIGAASDHREHVRTQLPYAFTVASVAVGLGYLAVGRGWYPFYALLAAFSLFALIFLIFGVKNSRASLGRISTQKEG